MDDPVKKPVTQPQPVPETPFDLREQLESIRHLTMSAMVFMLITAGAFDLFILRQYKNENQELTVAHSQVDAALANWQKYEQPAIDNFLQELAKYAQTHQDVNPILMKYGLTIPSNSISPMSLPAGPTGAASARPSGSKK